MIPIDGRGGAGRSAAEAVRQAAERARAGARRAAAEAARRAALAARRNAAADVVEPRPQTGPFRAAGPAATTPAATSANVCYAPAELNRMVASGGLDAVASFPPTLGPSASGPGATPPDPLEDAAARGLVRVFDQAAAAWAALPPDLQPVAVRPDQGASAIVERWVEGGRQGIGPGDPAVYESYFDRNRGGLLELAEVLAPPDTTPLELYTAGDMTGYVNQLVRPALVALQREHPDASLQLLAVESGTLPPRMMGMNGIAESQLVIQVTEGSESQHFALNPYGLFEAPPVNQTLAALESNAPLLESWYENVQASLPGHVDQGDAAATLDYLMRMRADNAVIEGLLELPLAAQADFFEAYGAVDPSSGERPFGLLNRIDHIGPENVIVSVDASALAEGSAPASLDSLVNLAAVDGLGKIEAFTEQNYETLVAPTFAQYATLRGDAPRLLAGTDLVNEIGTAMQLAPNHIPADAAAIARFEAGSWELYGGEAMEVIAPVAEAIEDLGTPPARVTALPITFHSPETGIVQLPLFRVEGADGQELYVDNIGRTYQGFQDWRDNNELPPGRVTFPGDTERPQTLGHLAPAAEGRALTTTESTHAVVDTPLEHVVRVLDTAALVGGVVVGAALVVGTGGTALPVAAGAMAAWGAARSGGELIDRSRHGQTLSLADPEARAEWLNLGASALGIAALGSGSLARALASSGSRYAAAATGIARGLNVGAEVADVATMADLGLSLTNPDLSMEQKAAIVAQLAFWGGMTAAAARTAHGSGLYGLDAADAHLRAAAEAPAPAPEAGDGAVQVIFDDPSALVTLGPEAPGSGVDLTPAGSAPSWTTDQLDEVIANVEAGLPQVARLVPREPPMFRIDSPEAVVAGIRAAHEQGLIDLPPEVFHSGSFGSGDLSKDPRHLEFLERQIEVLTGQAPLDTQGRPVVVAGLSERPIETAGQHSDIRRFALPDGAEIYFKPLVAGEEGHGVAARGELIASRVNDMLGLESIPPTRLAWVEIDGVPVLGSVQEAIPPGFVQLSPDTASRLDTDSASFRDLQALDYLLNEKDRVPANIFASADGSRVMGIDSQGVVADGPIGAPSVVPWAETRTTSGGVLPESYSEGFIAAVSGLTPEAVRGQLDGLASPAEIDAFLIRLEIVRADIEAKHGVVARPGSGSTGPATPRPGVQ